MEKIFLTRKFHFCASHKYYNKKWSKEKNRRVFGKSINYHGHNYLLEVSITGKVDKETGMIINIDRLKKIVGRIIDEFDHKNLNEDIPYFKKIQPTVENISKVLFNLIKENLPEGLLLYKIRLYESDDVWADCYGDEVGIGKSFKFYASHRLARKDYSKEKNYRVFGKCSNPEGHGHEYRVFVIFKGKINERGFVVERKKLKKMEKDIKKILDHSDLNKIKFLKKNLPTGENILFYLRDKIPETLKDKISKIGVYETPRNIFEMEVI